MSTDDTYSGWSNRETWAVALHVNNDQGWQESVLDALRDARPESDCANCHEGVRGDGVSYRHAHATCDVDCGTGDGSTAMPSDEHRATLGGWRAGEIIRENVERALVPDHSLGRVRFSRDVWLVIDDIGSLWRVNWTELGEAFLTDLADE